MYKRIIENFSGHCVTPLYSNIHIKKGTSIYEVVVHATESNILVEKCILPTLTVYAPYKENEVLFRECKIGHLTVVGGDYLQELENCEVGTYTIVQSQIGDRDNEQYLPNFENTKIWVLDTSKCVGVSYKENPHKKYDIGCQLTKSGLISYT